MTSAQLAQTLGLSERALRDLRLRGMPAEKDGRRWLYPLAAIAWYLNQQRSQDTNDPDYRRARARREEALADVAELDRDERLGLAMSAVEYEEELRGVLQLLDAKLRGLPDRLGHAVVGVKSAGEGRKRVHRVIEDIRTELRERDQLEDFEDDDE